MVEFICHSGSTIQYNTMQSNVKKQKGKEKRFQRVARSDSESHYISRES